MLVLDVGCGKKKQEAGAGLSEPVDFGHDPQDVRLVLQEMREMNPVRAIIPDGPREMLQHPVHCSTLSLAGRLIPCYDDSVPCSQTAVQCR